MLELLKHTENRLFVAEKVISNVCGRDVKKNYFYYEWNIYLLFALRFSVRSCPRCFTIDVQFGKIEILSEFTWLWYKFVAAKGV